MVFLLLAGGAQTRHFEQAVAGPRCKWPRVQITDHPLPHDGGLRRAQHTHQPPMMSEQKPGSHNLCSPGLGHSCTHGPGAKPCASSACSSTNSQLASAPLCSASLWSSSHSCADTRLLLLLLHASAMAAQETAGVAANPRPSRGPHHTDV